MSLKFDQNTFEHDYIIQILRQYSEEIEAYPNEHPRTLDKYATQLTAFMNGKFMQAMENDQD